MERKGANIDILMDNLGENNKKKYNKNIILIILILSTTLGILYLRQIDSTILKPI